MACRLRAQCHGINGPDPGRALALPLAQALFVLPAAMSAQRKKSRSATPPRKADVPQSATAGRVSLVPAEEPKEAPEEQRLLATGASLRPEPQLTAGSKGPEATAASELAPEPHWQPPAAAGAIATGSKAGQPRPKDPHPAALPKKKERQSSQFRMPATPTMSVDYHDGEEEELPNFVRREHPYHFKYGEIEFEESGNFVPYLVIPKKCDDPAVSARPS